jgi:sterol 3beta-glucosyltransferase
VKVSIVALGTLGDVVPLTALGGALRRAGHSVRFATHSEFRPYVAQQGLGFAPMDFSTTALFQGADGQRWLAAHDNQFAFMRRLIAIARPLVPRLFEQTLDASRDADTIIYTWGGMFGHHVAEGLGIPSFFASLQPITLTRSFPSILAPPKLRLGGAYNRLTHLLTERAFWMPFAREFNRMRGTLLDLPPMPRGGIGPRVRQQSLPHLYGFSPAVVPRPGDWGPSAHVTGYWFPELTNGWQPPDDLTDFLSAGPPPVCVGFSSLVVSDPARLTDLVVTALRAAGQRGILLTGWGALQERPLGDDMYVAAAIPHDYLFPRVAAVVHPAGAGTSAATLRFGVPSVTLPMFSDQFFWARRLAHLGVAPAPLPWRRLSSEHLREAIEQTVREAGMRLAAQAVSEQIAGEDGVAEAIAVIENHVSTYQKSQG